MHPYRVSASNWIIRFMSFIESFACYTLYTVAAQALTRIDDACNPSYCWRKICTSGKLYTRIWMWFKKKFHFYCKCPTILSQNSILPFLCALPSREKTRGEKYLITGGEASTQVHISLSLHERPAVIFRFWKNEERKKRGSAPVCPLTEPFVPIFFVHAPRIYN